jgi:hypothetical protein
MVSQVIQIAILGGIVVGCRTYWTFARSVPDIRPALTRFDFLERGLNSEHLGMPIGIASRHRITFIQTHALANIQVVPVAILLIIKKS